MNKITNLRTTEKGSSLVELLLSLLLTATLVGISVDSFLSTNRYSHDNKTINHSEDVARTVLDMVSYDLRMIGAGMPMGQSNFNIGGAGLNDAPLPVLTTSDSDIIQFRYSPKGRDTVLTADFTPAPANLTFTVFNVEDFSVGDIVYISNFSVASDEGLQGTIDSTQTTIFLFKMTI